MLVCIDVCTYDYVKEIIFVRVALLTLLHMDQTTHREFQEYLDLWSKGLSAQLEQLGNRSP